MNHTAKAAPQHDADQRLLRHEVTLLRYGLITSVAFTDGCGRRHPLLDGQPVGVWTTRSSSGWRSLKVRAGVSA